MAFKAVDLLNPYFWIFLTGLMGGIGFGRFPFLYLRRSPKRQMGSRGWLFVSLTFSLAVVSAAACVFSTTGGVFSDQPVDLSFFESLDWLFLIGSSFLLGVLVRRFPRAGGIPVAVLIAALLVFSSFALKSWSDCSPDEEILNIRILAEGEHSVIKFIFPPEKELISTIEGRGILPVVETLDFSPAFFFLGKGRLYRINGLMVFGQSDPLPFLSPYTEGHLWGEFLIEGAKRFPFLSYSSDFPDSEPPELNETGILSFDKEGRLHFETSLSL